jgi:hypothetical protein
MTIDWTNPTIQGVLIAGTIGLIGVRMMWRDAQVNAFARTPDSDGRQRRIGAPGVTSVT